MFPFSFQSIFPGSSSMISSTLEEKLQKEDCKLEDLLDETNIVFELKKGNNKLFKFLNREQIKKLIRYIIFEPQIDDQIIGHKYPFVANDILSSDINLITDYFILNDKEYKEKNKSDEKEIEHKEEVENTLNIIENNMKIDENENLAKENEKVFDINVSNEEKKKDYEKEENDKKENNENNKENIEKKENENSFELLDFLLNFIMNDNKELNDVLSSYFSNIMIKLIDKYTSRIIKYLYFKRKDALNKIIEHSNQKSISILTVKLLKIKNLEFTKEEKEKEEEISNFRNQLIHTFFKSITIENKNYDVDVKINLLIELMEENSILNLFIQLPEIYNYLFDILSYDINLNNNYEITNSYYSTLNLLISILNQIEINKISLPENFDINRKNFSDCLILTLPKIIMNFEERKNSVLIESQCDQPYKSLGMINLKILDLFILIMNYLKKLPEQYDNILIRNNFIKKSLNFFFNYQWNNIYHNSFVKFIKLYLNNEKEHYILTKYLFEEIKINQLFESFLKEKSNFIFNSKKEVKNGIYPHIIEIYYKLNAILGNKIFDEENNYNRKEGDFDFIKDENSGINSTKFKLMNVKNEKKEEEEKKEEKKEEEEEKINISDNLKGLILNNEDFKNIINEIINPTVKLYEKNLCVESPIPTSQTSEMSNAQLLIKLIGILKKAKENPALRDKLGELKETLDINKKEEKKENENEEINTDKIKKEVNENNTIEKNINEENSDYNDFNYWKNNSSILDDKTLEDCLNDL